jgi:hypothetical protein
MALVRATLLLSQEADKLMRKFVSFFVTSNTNMAAVQTCELGANLSQSLAISIFLKELFTFSYCICKETEIEDIAAS